MKDFFFSLNPALRRGDRWCVRPLLHMCGPACPFYTTAPYRCCTLRSLRCKSDDVPLPRRKGRLNSGVGLGSSPVGNQRQRPDIGEVRGCGGLRDWQWQFERLVVGCSWQPSGLVMYEVPGRLTLSGPSSVAAPLPTCVHGIFRSETSLWKSYSSSLKLGPRQIQRYPWPSHASTSCWPCCWLIGVATIKRDEPSSQVRGILLRVTISSFLPFADRPITAPGCG